MPSTQARLNGCEKAQKTQKKSQNGRRVDARQLSNRKAGKSVKQHSFRTRTKIINVLGPDRS
jgi:hypothetical protein